MPPKVDMGLKKKKKNNSIKDQGRQRKGYGTFC